MAMTDREWKNYFTMRRWMAFDVRLTDEELAECFEPYVLTEIDRERGIVEWYSIDHNLGHFGERMRDRLEFKL